MSYIRLTLATPPPDRLAEVRQCYEELVAYVATLPGFVTGWVVTSGYGDREVGRLTVWQSEAAAHRAANDPHAMALHAQLRVAVAGQLWDRSVHMSGAPIAVAVHGRGLDRAAVVRTVEACYQQC